LRLDNSVDVIKYLIASILVGVILGIGGALRPRVFDWALSLFRIIQKGYLRGIPTYFFIL
jgi:ABC-type arginine transport system permease subunit